MNRFTRTGSREVKMSTEACPAVIWQSGMNEKIAKAIPASTSSIIALNRAHAPLQKEFGHPRHRALDQV